MPNIAIALPSAPPTVLKMRSSTDGQRLGTNSCRASIPALTAATMTDEYRRIRHDRQRPQSASTKPSGMYSTRF